MHEYWCGSIAGYWVWSDNSPGIRWMECITHAQRWTRTSPWTSVQCPGLDLSDFHSAQGWDLAWSWSSASHVKLDLGTFNTHICIPVPDTDTWKGSFLEHVLQDDILIVNTNAGTTWWSHFSYLNMHQWSRYGLATSIHHTAINDAGDEVIKYISSDKIQAREFSPM